MRPLTARIIYCLCLCGLAACAALPEPSAAPASTGRSAYRPVGIAADLAAAIHQRHEAVQSYGVEHPDVVKIVERETSLRDSGLYADPKRFERNLIEALSYELANARRDRTALSVHYGETHPATLKADAVVLALMTDINAEVRRVKTESST